MSFTGFTESQISRDGKPAENQSQQGSNKKVTKTKQVARQQYRKTVSTEEKHFDIPNEARLSLQADTKTGNPDLLKNLDKTVNSVGPLEYKETTAENSEEKSQQEVDKSNEILNEKENVDTLGVETTSPSNHVESVLEKQKEIEAENRKKKEAIKKALDDRKSKTAQESQKLHNVQNELQKIDQIVAGDVRLLRKTIEEASYAYMEAQKRYEKAEKEFITAKESLFLKSERKDQLTAHLANIIQLNEERKAKKLTELMEELNIPVS